MRALCDDIRALAGLAVGPLAGGRIETHGGLQESRAWSTMKVPAALRAGHADWDDIEAAIMRSDNDAALRLWDRLGDGAAEVEVGIAGAAVIAVAARAADFESAKRLASKHVPQHPNAP